MYVPRKDLPPTEKSKTWLAYPATPVLLALCNSCLISPILAFWLTIPSLKYLLYKLSSSSSPPFLTLFQAIWVASQASHCPLAFLVKGFSPLLSIIIPLLWKFLSWVTLLRTVLEPCPNPLAAYINFTADGIKDKPASSNPLSITLPGLKKFTYIESVVHCPSKEPNSLPLICLLNWPVAFLKKYLPSPIL